MTETGWPLIPREILPAPLPAAKNRPARHEPPRADDDVRQLSIFGAETTEPLPADLAGLLAGPGRIGRMGGTARVSVAVDAAWRVHVLAAELVRRGLVVSWQTINQDQADVRDETLPVLSDSIDAPENIPRPSSPSRPSIGAAGFDPDADPPPVEFDPDADPVPFDPGVTADPVSVNPVAADPVAADPVAADPISADPGVTGDPTPMAEAADPGPVLEVAEPTSAETGESDETILDTDELLERPRKPLFEVRTAYSSRLNGLAQAWPDEAAQLFLSGPRLRLWVAAAGAPAGDGYALGLDPGKDLVSIDAALVRAGLAGHISDDGRHYVITGRRRLGRLAELVGERPPAAPVRLWPGGAGA